VEGGGGEQGTGEFYKVSRQVQGITNVCCNNNNCWCTPPHTHTDRQMGTLTPSSPPSPPPHTHSPYIL